MAQLEVCIGFPAGSVFFLGGCVSTQVENLKLWLVCWDRLCFKLGFFGCFLLTDVYTGVPPGGKEVCWNIFVCAAYPVQCVVCCAYAAFCAGHTITSQKLAHTQDTGVFVNWGFLKHKIWVYSSNNVQ